MGARFLIAHPDQVTVRALEIALREDNHDLRSTSDGLEAIDRALDDKPDVIILAGELHGLRGLDVARALRALEPTRRIPILFLALDEDEMAEVHRSGLPFIEPLCAPIDLARLREQSMNLLQVKAPQHDPRPGEPDKHLVAISDPLTGLYDRHYLLHRLSYEAARSARYSVSLACILCGVNHMQEWLKQPGRVVSDLLLVELANVLRRGARVADVIGRTGGDEFLILAPHTDEKHASQFAARLQKHIHDHHFELPNPHPPVAISLGLASSPGTSLADNLALFGRAEAALQRARMNGNGKIVVG